MPISIYDTTTPILELRDTLGWEGTQGNLENLVMVLCQRVAVLEDKVEELSTQPAEETKQGVGT